MKNPFSKLKSTPFFSNELAADPILKNYPRQVKKAHFSKVKPTKFKHPELIHFSKELADELEVNLEDKAEFTDLVCGNKPINNFSPFAMCYGGHQFGHWAGQLGDGRAINIFETTLKNSRYTFQLKGAGPTPYSRSADGYAVLRSSIREYLCSEAMHHLHIPTTRALSLVKTGEKVSRDMLYDGNTQAEFGAVVCRVAPSFIRFGNFEIFSARGEVQELQQLVDFTIKHHFPALSTPGKSTYLGFFQSVVNATKDLIVHWQRVGFVHGVMNTDNLSILGLTIDYGPYGWMDNYDGTWTPNTTDREHRRYRFENQPNIALWNLVQLANALYPLIEEAEPLEKILDGFKNDYTADYHRMMCRKLGLQNPLSIPHTFVEELTTAMTLSEIDMTLFFRKNAQDWKNEFGAFWRMILEVSYQSAEIIENHKPRWQKWFSNYTAYLSEESQPTNTRVRAMNSINPKYVLRNYMAQQAIEEAEKGNYDLLHALYDLLRNPYAEQIENEKWFVKRPDWAKNKIGCSMLSCSS